LRSAPRVKAFKASTVSPYGREWLSRSDKATVLHVFKKSCNLVNSNGQLVSLVTSELGPGPFSVVLFQDEALKGRGGVSDWVRDDLEARIQDGKILLGTVVFDVNTADVWDPKPDWAKIHAHRDWLMTNQSRLLKLLLEEVSRDSLIQIIGDLLPGKNQAFPSSQSSGDLHHEFHNAVIEPARWVLEGIAYKQPSLLERGLFNLLGLGGGLTPAGDDFILGVIFALRILFGSSQAKQTMLPVRQLAEKRTNRLSSAYLRAAVEGEASFPWHVFFEAILSEDTAALFSATRSLINQGQTSGSDSLIGLISMVAHGSCFWVNGKSRFGKIN